MVFFFVFFLVTDQHGMFFTLKGQFRPPESRPKPILTFFLLWDTRGGVDEDFLYIFFGVSLNKVIQNNIRAGERRMNLNFESALLLRFF